LSQLLARVPPKLPHARISTMLDDPLRPLVSAYADAFELLAAATTGRTRRGSDGLVLAICGAPLAAFNGIISPSREPDPDEIASLANSETWDCPWSIQVRGDPGPLVTQVAARHGLTEVTRQPLMVRPPELGVPAEPTIESLRVRAISEGELRAYAAAVADGFEAPRQMFEVMTNPAVARIEGVTFYFAELDGIPVGTGMTAVSGDVTGIYQIATFPQYRRRGYGRAVTTEMVRAGFAAGAATAYLYASEMGESIYIATGFRTEEYLTVIAAPS
jgi:ribosomal protein S18 acetylase RimI-like enzyme